nr:THAP domain-containing protein 1-like [Parasteatoda tepidariorum]
MASCVAYCCTNRWTKKMPGITFQSFPKDEKRKQLWIKAVRRVNWKPSSCSKLCNEHFSEDMIDRTINLLDGLTDSLIKKNLVNKNSYC